MRALAGRRVLMLLENCPYPQDGRVRREATTLTGAGYHVTVIGPASKGQPWRERCDGVAVYRYPAPPDAGGLLGYLWEYAYSMIAAFVLSLYIFVWSGIDIVHAHNPPDTFVIIAAFYKLLGKQFVYDHHDLSPEMYYARFGGGGSRLIYRLLVALEQLSCRLADRVIATNQSYKSIEIQRGGVPDERIAIVRNGPELHRIRPVAPEPELRPKDTMLLVYVGVMGVQDGVDYLLRALRHLAFDLDRGDFACVLVGTGDALPSLRSLARQLGLSDHVHFVGWLEHVNVLRYLNAADICVAPEPSNPYNDRSTMIKIMEYMAVGKPIVAFDLPEHRFTAQAAALYARPNDEREFARALAQLMDDRERCQVMGAFGLQRVQTELAWSYSVPNLLETYRSLEMAPYYGRVRSS
jgi:glycosyltransferase involved in cell wall biosynthesis